MAEVS